ncbi:unnamed protein product [Gongylonema pulchrum]|uniref:Conjugal transfer protein n=1 Tax=Gongylonema pulchrum TaxID=637853 RepID=A0A183EKG1_9BILA|nr:unnamed protein product [Gongylonema pulchrum]
MVLILFSMVMIFSISLYRSGVSEVLEAASAGGRLQLLEWLFPRFVVDELSVIPGMVGLFAAAIYSAGLSTVSASYSALAAVFIEDVIKQYRAKVQKCDPMKGSTVIMLARYLRMLFALPFIAWISASLL